MVPFVPLALISRVRFKNIHTNKLGWGKKFDHHLHY